MKAKTKSTMLVLKFTVLKKERKRKKKKERKKRKEKKKEKRKKKKRNKEEKKTHLATTCKRNKTDQIDRSHSVTNPTD